MKCLNPRVFSGVGVEWGARAPAWLVSHVDDERRLNLKSDDPESPLSSQPMFHHPKLKKKLFNCQILLQMNSQSIQTLFRSQCPRDR